jgi:hypothetical protein
MQKSLTVLGERAFQTSALPIAYTIVLLPLFFLSFSRLCTQPQYQCESFLPR